MLVRLLSLLTLIILAVAPISLFKDFLMPEVQLIVATIIVGVLVVYDAFAGFILAIGVIVLYMRLYGTGIVFGDNDDNALRKKGPMANLVTNYITPQHLKDAQDNTVVDEGSDTEIIGIKGVYGEPVWGAQGLDKTMPGYEENVGSYWSM